MIFDQVSRVPARHLRPDVLIVGAGAVGIALAVRLARANLCVTVVEGGPLEVESDFRERNRAGQTGKFHEGLAEGRMQVFGGTTRLWGGQLMAFAERDLEAGGFPGKPGWPVSHADLRSATDEALALLGASTNLWEPFEVLGADAAIGGRIGDSFRIELAAWLPQPDFTRLFGTDLTGLPGLCVVANAPVKALEFPVPGKVGAVVVGGANGTDTRFAAPRVVLANGTLEISRLLLRTQRDEGNCGFAANRHVGKWFIDHLHAFAGKIEDFDRALLGDVFDPFFRQGRKHTVKLRASEKLLRQAGIPNVALVVFSGLSIRELVSDLRAMARRLVVWPPDPRALLAMLRAGRVLAGFAWRYLRKRRIGNMFDRTAHLGIEIEQIPCAESRVELETGPAGEQLVLHWGFDGREIEAAATVAEHARDVFARAGLGRVVIDPRLEARDPAFLDACHDAYHQMGGARMAQTAEEGVVDAHHRVFGTQNLYVAGAAVFPSGSYANPTLTAIAMAMLLARHLEGECAADAAAGSAPDAG